MKGIIVAVVVALVVPWGSARADDSTPTKDQLDAAKKAYLDGKALHEQGKLVEAIDKFKESYRLSKNPVLLYNIGFTLDEAGQKDNALLYYRKFLADAPPTAAQRAAAGDRVKVLEKEKLDADLAATPSTTKPAEPTVVATTPTEAPEPRPRPEPTKARPTRIKPAGTYSASDFQHQTLDSAPPSKPLDVTAYVPEDSGFVVTLYYRGKGDEKFTAKQMKWRYKELVARIPAAKMTGSAVQYFIKVADAVGTMVTESGKSTDPNLVSIEAGAPTHYYTDLPDDGGAAPVETKRRVDEDPLAHKTTASSEPTPTPTEQPSEPVDTGTPGQGFLDVGSKKFTYTKWGTTGAAGLLLLGGIIFYIEAGQQASYLQNDAKTCPVMGATPPCRVFDSYDSGWQSAGERFQTLSNIGLGVGIVAAGVAGYYWYRELTAKKHHQDAQPASTASPEMTWFVLPAAGDGFAGAVAAARF